jgi:hypothetical protein
LTGEYCRERKRGISRTEEAIYTEGRKELYTTFLEDDICCVVKCCGGGYSYCIV